MDAVCGQEKEGNSSTQELKNSKTRELRRSEIREFKESPGREKRGSSAENVSEGSSLCLLLTWAARQREGKVA